MRTRTLSFTLPTTSLPEGLLNPSVTIQFPSICNMLSPRTVCKLSALNKQTRDRVDQHPLLKYRLEFALYHNGLGHSQGFLDNFVRSQFGWTDMIDSDGIRLLRSLVLPRLRYMTAIIDVDNLPFIVDIPSTTLEMVNLDLSFTSRDSALEDDFILPRYWNKVGKVLYVSHAYTSSQLSMAVALAEQMDRRLPPTGTARNTYLLSWKSSKRSRNAKKITFGALM